jgi:hypothetical protein
MNRRGFLRGLGLAIAAVAVAPAVKLLIEEETVCTGMLAQIRASGSTIEYNSNPTVEDFERLVTALNDQYEEEDEWFVTYSGQPRGVYSVLRSHWRSV